MEGLLLTGPTPSSFPGVLLPEVPYPGVPYPGVPYPGVSILEFLILDFLIIELTRDTYPGVFEHGFLPSGF